MRALGIAMAIACLVLPGIATAQLDAGFLAGQSAQMGTSMYLADMVRKQSGGVDGSPRLNGPHFAPSGPRLDRPLAPPAALTFRPDAGAARASTQRMLARMRRTDQAGAATFQRALGSGSVMSLAGQWMARYGMSTNNLGDCVATYLVNAWLATRGSTADPSPAQMNGLRRQMALALRRTPELARASDATKQEMASTNLFQAILAGSVVMGAKGTYIPS